MHNIESGNRQAVDHSEQIGAGFGAKVFLVELPDGQKLAKKVFDPVPTARLAYRAIQWKEHPYQAPYAEFVIKGAYELRKIAHGIAQAFDCGVEIVDAIGLCEDELGFYSPYIADAASYSPSDEQTRESLDTLERHFLQIGLPVWSFGSYLKEERRKNNVLVSQDGKAYIVDYEAGWPYFNSRDLVGFDDVDALKFQRFLVLGSQVLANRLGEKEFLELLKSWEKYQLYNSYWKEQESAPIEKIKTIKQAFNWRSLDKRRKMLLTEGQITPEEAEQMRIKVIADHKLIERLLPHFLAHFSTLIFLRFPFGSIARPTYTGVMRVVDELARIGNERKRNETQIHDFQVMFFSGIPFWIPPCNFFAYLTKVLGEEPLSFLILDNLSFHLTGMSLEEQMEHLGSHDKIKSIMKLRESENSFVRQMAQTIEFTIAHMLSRQVVDRSIRAIQKGVSLDQDDKAKPVLNEELVLVTEGEIEKKYQKLKE